MEFIDINPFYGRRLAGMQRWKRALLRILPLHLALQLKVELLAWRSRALRRNPRRAFAGKKGLLVNVGSGARGQPGWVNLDFLPAPGVTCVCDCRRGLPFDDNSVEGIFTEHYLEHIDYTEEVLPFLLECRRVLVPGGAIRIIVPDAGRYLRSYAESGWDAIARLRDLGSDGYDRYTGSTYRTKMELVNEVFRQGYTHKFAYDAETLIRVVRDAGFSRAGEQQFGQSQDVRLLIDQPARRHESLYVEGVK